MMGEAANGRTANAIRQMQLESELRVNPDLRAERFVQAWQQLRARRDKLEGWQNEDARGARRKPHARPSQGPRKGPGARCRAQPSRQRTALGGNGRPNGRRAAETAGSARQSAIRRARDRSSSN